MTRAALLAGALAALAAGAAPPAAAESSRGKLRELEEILRSRNDDDPRLDHDFDGLSPETKRLFRRTYRRIAVEKRNARGTVVYLLGRNLETAEDWDFLRSVALEPPCLSLSDCAMKPAPGSDEEAAGDEVTLAYPSLVALRQARRAVEEGRASASKALALFGAAKGSRTRAVARMAASIERRLAPP